jgi:2,4-dienoyl-CoA reductase-like NADH-dependent reductase (Old Yellow Enzyme family)
MEDRSQNISESERRRRAEYPGRCRERRIFSSGRIGDLQLKNCLLRIATAENACRDGVMTDEGFAIYRALGQGVAGLIITGNMATTAGGRYTELSLNQKPICSGERCSS